MAEADIPVDLLNPGQVFACLGFLETADILIGDAEGGFDWRDEGAVRFRLRARGSENPFESVLRFLSEAEVKRLGPIGYADLLPKDENKNEEDQNKVSLVLSETFPGVNGDQMALPILFSGSNYPVIEVAHWADGSSRENFKLYAGNRSADKIANAMLKGVRKKPSKKQKQKGQPGDPKTKGIAQLWKEDSDRLIKEPFHVLTPIGGSFNFDPRGAWTAIDAGFSPNDQSKISVEASPVVELMAACGLEHARPEVLNNRQVRYAAWGLLLSPMLARAALADSIPLRPAKHFHFTLRLSGKNKIVTFAEQI